jgi:hypothetical protein
MKYKKLIIGAIASLIVSVGAIAQTNQSTVPIAQTTVSQGIWRFSLSGRGVANIATPASVNNNSSFGGEIEVSHALKLGLPGEIGIRQDFSSAEYTTLKTVSVKPVPPATKPTKKTTKSTTSDLQYGTKVFYDWQLFKVGNVAVDAGGNVGAYYGSSQAVDWQTSPEVDARLFLTKNINTFVRAEYPFDINKGEFTGELVGTVGFQFRF